MVCKYQKTGKGPLRATVPQLLRGHHWGKEKVDF